MASLKQNDATRSFDVATSLLIQCRMAHQELQGVAAKEGKLLHRLCNELQSLRKSQVPDGFEVALRNDSEIAHREAELQPELRSFNPDTEKMITKIAVFDESGSPTIHLPRPVSPHPSTSPPVASWPISEEPSESPLDERSQVGVTMTERQSERPSQDSMTWQKTNSRRISVYSSESRTSRNAMLKPRRTLTAIEMESDPVQSYSINGIKRKEPMLPRNTLTNVLKSNFAVDKRGAWWSRRVLSIADFIERCWQLEEPERVGFLARVVRSNFFGALCGAVIFANAIFILYATDYEMQHLHLPESEQAERITGVELVLASFYVFELALKLIVHRLYFFWNSEMPWNYFDFILVVFSIIENILVFSVQGTDQDSGGSGVNLGFLRLLRLCKIVKILRVFRTLRFFSELRLMLDCVVGSLMNVFWCLIMLIFVMYVFALLLQQGVVQYLSEARTTVVEENTGLATYFSSVGVTVVTLFQSCTSGVDWNEPYKALESTGSFLHIAFLLYIAFVFISVWNIVTSSFVEKALKLAQPDVDMLILEQQLQDFEDCRMLASLFKRMLKTDEQGHERLGLEEFRKLVETDEFRSYLQTRGIDIKNAETFFKMLVELQGEETIDASTFANACVRMKGAATSIDLQTVMFTTHLMNKEQRRAFQNLFARVVRIEEVLIPEEQQQVIFDYPISEDSQEDKAEERL